MPDTCSIELRTREANHLFDPLDASSLTERDLNHRVEEFIVESLKELDAKKVCEVVLHFDQPRTIADEEQVVARAIRGYFARRAKVLQLKLHRLIRRGSISLVIGLAFLGLRPFRCELLVSDRFWSQTCLSHQWSTSPIER